MSVGRPTKYDPKFCKKLIEHMKKGFSYRSFAGVIGVCFDTLYEWEKVHKEFSYAKKIGRGKGLHAYESLILKAAKGEIENFNSTAAVWFGKNVYNWRDKSEVKQETTQKIQINIDSEDAEL